MYSDDDSSLGAALQKAAEKQARRPALYDVAAALTQMVRCAVDTVSGADAGGVSVTSSNTDVSHGASSTSAADLDATGQRLGEGPCQSALHDPEPGRAVVVAEDLGGRDATRWPRFAPSAVELGFPAMLSLQPPAPAGLGAALNFYGRDAGSFEPADLVLADMFVEHLAQLLFGQGTTGAPRGEPAAAPSAEIEHELRRTLDHPAAS